MRETILSIPSPTGPSTDLLKFSWEGTPLRETVSIIGGIHGNHLNGIYLCSRLIRFLDAVEAGNEPDYFLKGRVQIIPAVNLPALQEGNRLWSFDDLDMDLAFPGNNQGEVAERIAAIVYQHTYDSQFGIIISNADTHYEDAPHLACLNPDGLTKDFARSLGPQNAREPEDSPTFRLCLYHQWIENRMPSVILSAGKPDHLDRALCETLFSGLVNSLLWAGVLTNKRKKVKKFTVRFNNRNNERLVFADAGGMFLPLVQSGSKIKKGQKIGEIVDMYSGAVLESPLAPSDGYLVTLRDHPVVYQKEVLAVLLRKQKFSLWPF